MAIHGRKARIDLTSGSPTSFTNEAMTDSGTHQYYTITNQAKRYLDPATAVVTQKGNDEIQTVTITGSPTGGTFTLTFGANTTSAIAYNAAASAVQSALVALASIGSGNAAVTGSAGGPYTVRFQATLGLANQSPLTKDATGITGGSSPNVTIATVQDGGAYATISSGFTLQLPGAKVSFDSAQPLGTQVRLASGKYYTYAAVAVAREWAPDVTRDVKESTTMTTSSTPTQWRTFVAGLLDGMFKLSDFMVDDTFLNLITAETPLFAGLVIDVTTGSRLDCQVLLTKDSLKAMVDDLETEELDFKINGPVYLTQ